MSLPELNQLEKILHKSDGFLHGQRLMNCVSGNDVFPIYVVHLGEHIKSRPTLCLVGGIHGIERIGSQILLSFLETLVSRFEWDHSFQDQLSKINILFLPIMNPMGMFRNRRANGNGVDLMRNAPVEGDGAVFLAGGQRFSSLLPWYRGAENAPLERETEALIKVIRENVTESPFSLVVDCHSGFGMHDRIWFPYARSREIRIPHLAEIYELRNLLHTTYPNLNYICEPQSKHYVTHGDIWDYLYDEACEAGKTMIPLTLELGSWLWVKKNPVQATNPIGIFHPMKPHRVKRVLRHHQLLLDFFIRATLSHRHWIENIDRGLNEAEAENLWYLS